MKFLKIGVIALGLASAACAGADPEPQGDQLRLVVVLTRHGVRSPLLSNEAMAAFAAQPWPKWEVAPGLQTPHGNLLIAQMGDYYHARFQKLGLLTGEPDKDGALVYVRADNDQRTIETARILGKALVDQGALEVHALDPGQTDPLFRPFQAHVGHPDRDLAAAAVLGRVGGDITNVDRAYAAPLAELRSVLFGPGGGAPVGSPFAQPSSLVTGGGHYLVDAHGPLVASLEATDALLLEYVDGMPASDVGWGRVDAKVMTDLLGLHELFFDLAERSFYPAQVGGSNLASHLIDTLEQAALELPVPGAIGPVEDRVVLVVGHDSNIANIGGLLGLDWCIPGTAMNPTLPGGALVFELWKRTAGEEHTYFVRASYVSQTLEQMREGTALSLENPPARAPIFIPGASGPGPFFDAPLNALLRQARKVINPDFIAAEP